MLEYVYIQHKVTKLCKAEGGITVYVTPEEWKQQIGEEEWLEIRPYQTRIEVQNYPKGNFIFNGKEYFPTNIINRRIVKYSGFEGINKFTQKTTSLVVDLDEKKILFQYIYYSSGVGGILSENGHKFWLNSINDCNDDVYEEYQNLITYYSNSQEEKL